MNFFRWFEEVLPKLEKRAVSIKKIIDYILDSKDSIKGIDLS